MISFTKTHLATLTNAKPRQHSQYGDKATGYIPDTANRFFSSPQRPDHLWDPPASYSMGTRKFYPGNKPNCHEFHRLPPSSAKGKNVCSYTSTLPCNFLLWCLIKQSDMVTFTLDALHPIQHWKTCHWKQGSFCLPSQRREKKAGSWNFSTWQPKFLCFTDLQMNKIKKVVENWVPYFS